MIKKIVDWGAGRFQAADLTKPSVVTLILANTIPLLGVLFAGWSTFAIVVVYWAENVIIGIINVFKMLVCAPTPEALRMAAATDEQRKRNSKQVQEFLEKQSSYVSLAHHGSKLFFIPFFTFHYGMFCAGHGFFIFTLLGKQGTVRVNPVDSWPWFWERIHSEGLAWAVLALAASHLFSFFSNFLYRGEFKRVTVPQLMFQPYGRIVILHIAILLGAFLIMALGSPVWMLVILIFGKTILDIALHVAEHEKNAAVSQSIGELV